MICSKCGKEIKDGNNFCTNCGTPVNKIEDNKNVLQKETEKIIKENNINVKTEAKKKSNKMKIIIPIIIVILIIICIVVVIILRNKNNEKTNTNEVVEEQQETAKIEIGTNYNCSTYGVTGYINFNTETSFVMNMTYDMSESVTYNGTYKIEGDTITLTVTYYDMAEDPETFEPYTETINILEDGTLKYTSNGATYIFDKNLTLSETSAETTGTTTGDLLEQIYTKYPSLEGTEGIVCTDGTDYWLLDETGDKVYFTDLTSFEEALKECNIDVNSIGNTSNNKNNNTSNTNVNKNTSTTSKSNNNANNTVEQEKTFKIDFHRSCLAENFLDNINDTLDEPLNVTVKADDKVIFTDQITNADLRSSTTDDCKTSIISYTGTTPPTITVLVNGNTFRTYDKDYTSSWFYSDSTEPYYMGFTEHGAG